MGPVNRFSYTNLVAVVTRTDLSKTIGNRCVIEIVGGVFVLSLFFLDLFVDKGAFVMGLSHISSSFSYTYIEKTM